MGKKKIAANGEQISVAKKRRRASSKNGKVEQQEADELTGPATMVVRRGENKNVKQLVRDMRLLLSPSCAMKLQERKNNTVKDFTAVAGQLGVTHLLVFKTSELGNAHLKIPRLPHGPTLTFRISEYTLSSDLHKLYPSHTPGGNGYLTPPLLVLNGFLGVEDRHVQLIKLTFNDMFPQFNINKIKMEQIKRIVLLDYKKETDTLEMRHYVATTPDAEVASPVVMSIMKGKITNFGEFSDISDFFLGNKAANQDEATMGATEEEEKEKTTGEDKDVVEFETQKKSKTKVQKKKVTLVELGPRLTMQLVKIEDKVFEGEVHYHRFVQKTPEEIEELRIKKKKQEATKLARKEQQEKNILTKKGEEVSADEESSDSLVDDLSWYRKEVGQEPDKETADILNASTRNANRSTKVNENNMNKPKVNKYHEKNQNDKKRKEREHAGKDNKKRDNKNKVQRKK